VVGLKNLNISGILDTAGNVSPFSFWLDGDCHVQGASPKASRRSNVRFLTSSHQSENSGGFFVIELKGTSHGRKEENENPVMVDRYIICVPIHH
jgi:hypothetical protein